MLGLFGERQTAGVQHLVLPPTDWQFNQLSNNLTLQVISFFPWEFYCKKFKLGLGKQLVYGSNGRMPDMEELIADAV